MANKLRMDLELDSKGYVQGAQEASHSTKDLNQETQDYIKTFGPLTKQLRNAKKEAEDLAGQFASLSRAEKQSEIGKSLKGDLDFAIAKATELQDVLNDTREAIRRGASDTQAWDALKEGIDIAKSATLAYAGAVAELTGNEQDLAKIVKTLTTIENTFNTVIKIGNALQEQSNIMLGIKKIQKWAAAVAEDMETKAKLKNTAATAANTVAETANAAATSKATAAVAANAVALNTNRSMLQKVFITIGKANPYVLLGVAILTATAAIGGYMLATSKSSAEEEKAKHQKERLKKAQEELKKSQEEFIKTMSTTFGDLMSKYNNLRNAWNKLGSEHEKTKWVEKNKKALNELGLSVKNVHDAEDVFEKNTSKVVDGFKKRAEAAAISARMTSLYTKSLELESQYLDRYNLLKKRAGDVDRSTGHQLDANGETYNNGESTYNKITGQFELTAKGAAKANRELTATDRILNDINDDFKENKNQIDIYNNKLIKLESNLSSATNSDSTKKQITELQKLIKVADDYNTKIENIKDPSSEKGKQELEELKVKWANAALEAEKYKHAIGLPVDTKNIEKIVDILNYTTKEAKDLKISLGVEIPKSKLQELKDKLKEAQTNLEFAISEEDVQKARAKINNLKDEIESEEVRLGIKVEPVSDGKDVKKVQDILQETFNKITPPKYDFSFIPDDFKYEGQSITDIENKYAALTEARKQLTEVMNTSTDDQAIHDAQIGLQSIGDEIDSLEPKLETLNKINEKFKQFQEISDAANKAGNYLNQLGSAFTQLGEATDSAGVKAVGIILETLANLALSFSQAMIQAASLGPWAWIAFGIAGVAQLAAMISQIKGMVSGGFAEGGVVPGSSFSGDKLLARVNSGERILTAKQNENLEKIANSQYQPYRDVGPASLSFKLKGEDLYGVMKNYKNIHRIS